MFCVISKQHIEISVQMYIEQNGSGQSESSWSLKLLPHSLDSPTFLTRSLRGLSGTNTYNVVTIRSLPPSHKYLKWHGNLSQ